MKLNIRKFGIGGDFESLAVNYIPISASTTAGAYAPAVDSSDSKAEKSDTEKEDLNLKDLMHLFDNLQANQADAQYVLDNFNRELLEKILLSPNRKLSTQDIVPMMMSIYTMTNSLKLMAERNQDVKNELIAKNSLDEVAIDVNGRVTVTDANNRLRSISLQEYNQNLDLYDIKTNRDLLYLRRDHLAFDDSVYNAMTGIGMDELIKKINTIALNIGTSEKTLQGYTAKLSDAIKSGLAILQDKTTAAIEDGATTVDGLYKNSVITKDLKDLTEYALKAIYRSLNAQEKTLLAIHSSNGSPTDFISNLILSRGSDTYTFETNYQSHLNIDGSTRKTEKEKQEAQRDVNPLLMMQMMLGGEERPLEIQTDLGKEAMMVPSKFYSAIPKADDGPMSVEQLLSKSGMGGILQGNGITFGDQIISRGNLNSVMYDNEGGYMALLPCVTDTLGNKTVDLSILDEYKEAAREISAQPDTPLYYRELALKLKEKGLDELLTGSDTLNLSRFQQFFIIKGFTTDKVLKAGNDRFDESAYIREVKDPSVADRMKQALSSKENGEFEIDPYDKWGIFEFWNGWDDIYVGTMYIPITSNQNSPYFAYGLNIKQNFADQNETDYQRFNSKLRGFNPNNSYIQ